MRSQLDNRPASVLVIALFHFAFGGMGLLCNLWDLTSRLAGNLSFPGANLQPAQVQADVLKITEKNAPGYRTIEMVDTLFPLIFSIVLIAAGIGLLNRQPWGRKLSLAYAFAALIEKVGMAFYSILVLLPALDESMREMFHHDLATPYQRVSQFAVTMAKLVMIASIAIPLLYPFVVLLVMNTTAIKVWFAEAGMTGTSPVAEGGPDAPSHPRPDDGSSPGDRYRTR